MKDESYVAGEIINIVAYIDREDGKSPDMEVRHYTVLIDFDMDEMRKQTELERGFLRSYLIDNGYIEPKIIRTSALF
jgi:hypothetical protein